MGSGKARLASNFRAIRELHHIKKTIDIRFDFVDGMYLVLSPTGTGKPKIPVVNPNPKGFHKLVNMHESTNDNSLAKENNIWRKDVPLWESAVSKSMVKGGQPLVSNVIIFSIIIIHFYISPVHAAVYIVYINIM